MTTTFTSKAIRGVLDQRTTRALNGIIGADDLNIVDALEAAVEEVEAQERFNQKRTGRKKVKAKVELLDD